VNKSQFIFSLLHVKRDILIVHGVSSANHSIY